MTLRFLTAGESHGPSMLAILEGIPAGLALPAQAIQQDLLRRQSGYGAGPRMKIEQDEVQILSGVMDGVTTGAPLALQIENRDHSKWRSRPVEPFTIPRPGHADLVGAIKYGYNDLRPSLERASARETVCRVAVGAVCRQFLSQFDIRVGGYVCAVGKINADLESISLEDRIARAFENPIHCPDPHAAEAIQDHIRQAMQDKDTLGGVIEAVALGVPAGLGSFAQWDRRLDARLSGVQAQDAIYLEGAQLERRTNRAGGLEAGVTNGQPLVVRAAMKPIATTLTPQATVDLSSGVETSTRYERSDFCPVPRAVVIVEAMVAFVLADALLEKLGGDSMAEILPRFAALRKARLPDLPVDGQDHIFWEGED